MIFIVEYSVFNFSSIILFCLEEANLNFISHKSILYYLKF